MEISKRIIFDFENKLLMSSDFRERFRDNVLANVLFTIQNYVNVRRFVSNSYRD